MHPERGAQFAGQIRRRRPGCQIGALLLLGDLLDRKTGGGAGAIGQHVDALAVDPLARDGRRDIRLVLIVALHDLDRATKDGTAEIGDCQFGRKAIAGTADVAVRSAHVRQQSDLHRLGRALRPKDSWHGQRCGAKPGQHDTTRNARHA